MSISWRPTESILSNFISLIWLSITLSIFYSTANGENSMGIYRTTSHMANMDDRLWNRRPNNYYNPNDNRHYHMPSYDRDHFHHQLRQRRINGFMHHPSAMVQMQSRPRRHHTSQNPHLHRPNRMLRRRKRRHEDAFNEERTNGRRHWIDRHPYHHGLYYEEKFDRAPPPLTTTKISSASQPITNDEAKRQAEAKRALQYLVSHYPRAMTLLQRIQREEEQRNGKSNKHPQSEVGAPEPLALALDNSAGFGESNGRGDQFEDEDYEDDEDDADKGDKKLDIWKILRTAAAVGDTALSVMKVLAG